jgi:hypothetical protein
MSPWLDNDDVDPKESVFTSDLSKPESLQPESGVVGDSRSFKGFTVPLLQQSSGVIIPVI